MGDRDDSGESIGSQMLRSWRAERQLTLVQLAAILEVDDSTIAKLESGARKPGRSLAVTIQMLAGITAGSWDMRAAQG